MKSAEVFERLTLASLLLFDSTLFMGNTVDDTIFKTKETGEEPTQY